MSLEVRIASVVGEPTGHRLVEKLVGLGVPAIGSVGTSTASAQARVYWGCRGTECRQPALNKFAVTYTKLNELEKYKRRDIPCPQFWRNAPSEAEMYPILGRQMSHAEGRGINLYSSPSGVGGYNDYYTRVIPSTKEYRFWVFRDSIVGCYERTRSWPVEREGFGRNWWNGWGYTLVDSPSDRAANHAKAAVAALDLDFGAVDMLLGEDRCWYVLETNTCPGATSYCQRALENLATKIKDWWDDLHL